MQQVVTSKMPKKLVKELDEVSKIEQLDRSTVMRRLLSKALKEWKEQKALELYSQGELSTEQAAHYSGRSVWRFYDLLREKNVPIKKDLDDFKEELKVVKKWKQS